VKFPTSLFTVFFLLLTGNVMAQNCGINVTPMSFGSLDAMAGAATDSAGNISLDCDAQVSYLIRIDGGQDSRGGFRARRMRQLDGTALMDYNLYLDPSRVQIWGDGAGESQVVSGVNPGIPQDIAVYGRIFGGQNLAPGDYSDFVTIIVEW
jgi:spore coat protein U-like protein